MRYAKSCEAVVDIPAPVEPVFAFLDEQTSLGAHMETPSLMMLGGRMGYEFDGLRGKAVGAVIRMTGNVLWLPLFLEEVVTRREPPHAKQWETRGPTKLIVIGSYRMGFELAEMVNHSRARIFIDYNIPDSTIGRLLGVLFSGVYARWCVNKMADDARRNFAEIKPVSRKDESQNDLQTPRKE